jgi:dTDP-4-dehydrorhamnose 3,5-epimerase
MQIESTALAEVKILRPARFNDARGWFAETWSERKLADAGIVARFVQDNAAFSHSAGTIRGLHFQKSPAAQGKLVGVSRGAVLDVAVDIRRGSPTFGVHVAVTLTAERGEQLWIPAGFAHGYCSLVADTLVSYKATAFYEPSAEGGVYFGDPAIGIRWPVPPADAILADKDRALPMLADLPPVFRYGENL